jgi:lysophospholipase L1-like esterase
LWVCVQIINRLPFRLLSLRLNRIAKNNFIVTSSLLLEILSLDGVHPSPKGYAQIANKFLEAINAKYGSNFKGVNLGQYRILFPATL